VKRVTLTTAPGRLFRYRHKDLVSRPYAFLM
jgi:hypothetical protein